VACVMCCYNPASLHCYGTDMLKPSFPSDLPGKLRRQGRTE